MHVGSKAVNRRATIAHTAEKVHAGSDRCQNTAAFYNMKCC